MNKEQYIEYAKKTLDKHKYTLLSKSDECEVWECSRPNTNTYAFNIAILPMGICVVGDIGDYTFGVYGRGIDFLAGRDVEYYIHSKLTPNCKEVEFDTDSFKSIISDEIKDHTEEYYEDIFNQIKDFNFEEISNYLYKSWEDTSVTDDIYDFLDDITDYLKEVEIIEDAQSAYYFLNNCEILNFHDSFDYELTKPNECLVCNLYIINEASKQIVLQKNGIENDRDGGFGSTGA